MLYVVYKEKEKKKKKGIEVSSRAYDICTRRMTDDARSEQGKEIERKVKI